MDNRHTIFVLVLVGCVTSTSLDPDVLECEEAPTYLWHSDTPWPRGRIHACQTCAGAAAHFIDRAAELGCEGFFPYEVCTPSGACDYEDFVNHTTQMELAQDCEELDGMLFDPCVRPNPDRYWRPEGD